MATIRVTPQQLRQIADNLESHAARVQQRIGSTSQIIDRAVVGNLFAGQLATALHLRYRKATSNMETWPAYLKGFAQSLRETADAFEAADHSDNQQGDEKYIFVSGELLIDTSHSDYLLDSNIGHDQTANYATVRANGSYDYGNDYVPHNDPYYQEALKKIEGPSKNILKGGQEGEKHLEWRRQKEAAYLEHMDEEDLIMDAMYTEGFNDWFKDLMWRIFDDRRWQESNPEPDWTE